MIHLETTEKVYCLLKYHLGLSPFQKIFGDFVTVEMLFHAKALEVFTLAYQSIQNIDEEEDLEVSCGYSIYSPCRVLDEPDFC